MAPPDSPYGNMVLAVQVHGCQKPLRVTFSLEAHQSPMKWSHTFEDGDKVPMPTPTGPVNNMEASVKAELEKNGNKVHFKVDYCTYII